MVPGEDTTHSRAESTELGSVCQFQAVARKWTAGRLACGVTLYIEGERRGRRSKGTTITYSKGKEGRSLSRILSSASIYFSSAVGFSFTSCLAKRFRFRFHHVGSGGITTISSCTVPYRASWLHNFLESTLSCSFVAWHNRAAVAAFPQAMEVLPSGSRRACLGRTQPGSEYGRGERNET